jgi:hypothetical protein
MEDGEIEIDSIEPIGFPDITPQLARESGFLGIVDLLKIAKHGKGENIYLVRFHYVRSRPKQSVARGYGTETSRIDPVQPRDNPYPEAEGTRRYILRVLSGHQKGIRPTSRIQPPEMTRRARMGDARCTPDCLNGADCSPYVALPSAKPIDPLTG